MERVIEFLINHYLLSLAFVVVTYLLIQDLFETALKKYNTISPLLAVAKMNEMKTVVVDVRDQTEFASGHIQEAIHLPLDKFDNELKKIEAYKKDPVLVICQNGTRAISAGKLLTKAGFEQVFVISGGMESWQTDYKLPIKKSKKTFA
ncbi:rhodanese-like domain-containing protein [Methylocucumis oryzae]|uniref:Sulfurtransferase n=1 Tax=Methylocucumis oryzae TaxID=1632867 RepID=A0A0F3IHA9_9GAMM|nr:rhodanese-like domain-containing protein [Methylocucumis oryzae]KJV06131.1 sulfurtransferase [Methylocucumis oryzae]